MSDPKIISPLLDGFKLGAPICEHNGIVCHPAIKENSNKKYIVKIISVPANQSQLDALLLAGAYKDPADAMEYFRRKAEGILEEAEHLKVLSKLECFLPYDGWQMEPITRHRLGYEVYLVGSYKRSLEKYMTKTAFTHLDAVNLGLDLCSALSVCRQSGYIYVDLKPTNIYVSEKKEYRIGDIGFLNMDSLRYASLPDQYHSPYTPPELLDPMTSMNLSADTYAVGMILYQLYNDGHLPFKGIVPDQPMPTPIHADYEMAEIIMKAISPEPEQRWLDPKDLGKAIAGYMQRNSVNDIPITPFIPLDVVPEAVTHVEGKKATLKKQKSGTESADPESVPLTAESSAKEAPLKEFPENLDGLEVPLNSMAAASNIEEIPGNAESIAEIVTTDESTAMPPPSEIITITENQPAAEEKDLTENLSDSSSEVTSPSDPTGNHISQELSEEVYKIVIKADELIAHQIPDEVMYPSEPIIDPFDFIREDSEDLEDLADDGSLMDEEPLENEPDDLPS